MAAELHRQREKACARCGQPSPVMYRVVRREEEGWVFLCPPCRRTEAQDNPEYRYGGTWKAAKGRGGSA
ncbi:hypothetical protein DAETH_00200 [Deinococcus aetherius]|uniref:Uncharacterized protein n=1 Tax=Deinococcus aetherius TaxID=200252 RepID=A0ABM8A8I8_9DEIO|nr:hypothetical protein [Deinococcus aetherius]BDP40051.1 hypothetical protein DAETH_00200 [Deinococcus aetherius]